MSLEQNRSLTPLVSLATYLGMLSVGTLNSSFGAALGLLRQTYQVGDAQIGLLGTAATIGGVLGNLSTAWLERFLTAGQRLSLGALGFALGATGFAFAGRFELALVTLFVMGLGQGLIQVAMGNLFSRGFGARSGAVMTMMSTSFALGGIAGPTIAALLGGQYRLLPLGFALVSIGVAWAVLPAKDTHGEHSGAARGGLDLFAWVFAGMVFVYVIVEQGVGFWAVTHLERLGVPHNAAAFTVSGFWLALLFGRFALGALSLRFSSDALVLFSMIAAALCLLFTHFAPLAGPAYVLTGFFLAPVFPAGISWLARLNPSSLATTLYFMSGSLGTALGLPLIGLLKTAFGDLFIPTALTAASLVCALTLWWLWRRGAVSPTTAPGGVGG